MAIAAMVAMAAASRLLPHPPNFTPLAAMALLGGAYLPDKRVAFAVPLAALFLSDLVLGLHAGMWAVYGSFMLVVCLGFTLRRSRKPLRIGAAALASSVLFFALTNLAVWAFGSMYPKTAAGLAACYAAAIPFFRNTLAGDLFYTALLFGGFALAQRGWPALREPAPVQLRPA
jgi:hypothetical protein